MRRVRLAIVGLFVTLATLASVPQTFGASLDSGAVSPQDAYANGGASFTDLTSGVTAGALAQSLAGSGVTISNVTYTGSPRAGGAFTGGASSIGFDTGIALSTGDVETQATDGPCSFGLEGPNSCHEAESSDGATGADGGADSTAFGLPGDPDLDALLGNTSETTEDAAVLQFDFVPSSSAISFKYVFGSDEYSEYVGDFDDVFGFFVNGTNCATVPGTNPAQPVSVNTINNGNDSGTTVAASNPQFFRDNVNPSPSINTQLDGLTTVLTCTAHVNPGQVNHLKLAIADTGDDAVDSAVFIQAQSLSTQIIAAGTQAFSGTAPYTLAMPLATFTDPTTGTTAASYTASVNYGDGSAATPGTITGSAGSFSVAGNHVYRSPGTYTATVTVASATDPTDTSTATDQVVVTAPPAPAPTTSTSATTTTPPAPVSVAPMVVTGTPVVNSSSAAALSGTISPEGLDTTVHFQYGLDPRYNGGGPIVYDQSTPDSVIAGDFADHPVSDTVTDLIPNAEYHVQLIATNALGTTTGPDVTFTTDQDPAPPPPTLGKTANLEPGTGIVYIKLPGGANNGEVDDAETLVKGAGYIPLTETRQVPVGTQIDARRGTLRLFAPSGVKKQTHAVSLGGGLFDFGQAKSGLTKGLTTFRLLDHTFKGGPTYSGCQAGADRPGRIVAAAKSKHVPKGVVQTLTASEHGGKFATKGKYSAGTVEGTAWSVSDRCDGTLTKVKRGVVSVLDFRTRKTIVLHAGQSYLASAVAAKSTTPSKKSSKTPS